MISQINLRKIAYSLFIMISVGWLVYIGSSIIQPIVFATLFAIFLYPLDRRILNLVKWRWLSIILSFLIVLTPLLIISALFSMQLINILDSLPSIGESIKKGVDQVMNSLQDLFPFLAVNGDKMLSDNINAILQTPLNVLGQGLRSSSEIAVNASLAFIYTFFILYYRKSIKNFIIFQFEQEFREDIRDTLTKIKETIQAYVGGLGMVMILLATLNTLGLWIIGIKHPLFWGALSGLLAVIPYIGTFIGGLLPFLYSLATTDSFWQPLTIVAFYSLVQFLEGNIITPKIVGDKVNINPLIAIIALVFFGSIWGIGGVILGLPIISIVRIILKQFESTVPIAMLMSSEVADKPEKFRKWAEK